MRQLLLCAAAAAAPMAACVMTQGPRPHAPARPAPAGGAMLKMAIDTKGTGAPLLLVGGGLTGWQSWIPHQERLAATRQVLRAQLINVQLGLAATPLPDGYSVKVESAALTAGLGGAGMNGPIDIAAWSYGALVALDYALDHPEHVRSLTLIEPPALWVLDATGQMDERSRREGAEMEALHAGMRGDVSENQLEAFLKLAGLVPPDTPVRSMLQWPNWVKHRRSLLQGTAVFVHRDDATRLRAFDRPVLLVKGTGSTHFLHRVTDVLGATLPRARVVELPGGHAPHLVAMDDFLRVMAEFQDAAGRRGEARAKSVSP